TINLSVFFFIFFFFFSSRRRHTRSDRDWSSDVCSSDLLRQDIASVCHLAVERAGLQGPVGDRADKAASDDRVAHSDGLGRADGRSEERRVGKECRSRWWRGHCKKKE